MLIANHVGFTQGPAASCTASVIATLQSVFRNVRCFRDAPLDRNPESATNIVQLSSLLPLSCAPVTQCFVSLRAVVVPQVCFASRQPIQFRLPVASSPDEFTAATAVADFQSWEVTSAYLLAQGHQEAAAVSVSVLTAPAHGYPNVN